MYQILLCDDEKDIVTALEIYLRNDDYKIFKAYNGADALKILTEEEIHLVLLDIMMPHMDGIAEDIDKVLGLTVGADDYITKPFNPIELQARVKSQLRRYMQLGGGKTQSDVYSVGGIVLNPITKEVTLDSDPIALTRIEYNILLFLMQHIGQSFTPREIYQNVWHDNAYGEESTVAVHIRHLREKIEYNPAEPRYLKAVWGRGYKLDNN